MENEETRIDPSAKKNKPYANQRLGIVLIALSFVFYGALLLVPLMSISLGSKALITSGLILLGEVSFWVGGFLVGKEVVQKYKRYLNPLNWFKRDH